MTTIARSITLLALAITLIASTGCANLDESIARIDTAIDGAQTAKQRIDTEIDELELMRESIPDQNANAPFVDARLAQLRAQSSALDGAIRSATLALSEAQSPTDPLVIAVDSVSPWIPAPIQAPLVLAAALGATLIRSGTLKRAAASIIESIDHAKRADPGFRAALVSNANAIRSIQTPAARKLVTKIENQNKN